MKHACIRTSKVVWLLGDLSMCMQEYTPSIVDSKSMHYLQIMHASWCLQCFDYNVCVCVSVCGIYTWGCGLEQCASVVNHACILMSKVVWVFCLCSLYTWDSRLKHCISLVRHLCILMSVLWVLCGLRIWANTLWILNSKSAHHLYTMHAFWCLQQVV